MTSVQDKIDSNIIPADDLIQGRLVPHALVDELNEQLKCEFESSYMYLGMATYFDQLSLDGMAKWFRKQSQEEIEHGMKLYNFLLARGVDLKLSSIPAVTTSFESPLQAFEAALAHEQKITALIHNLYALSHKLEEYDCGAFLQWFLSEQVEEENTFSGIVNRLRMGRDAMSTTLLLLDRDLGSR